MVDDDLNEETKHVLIRRLVRETGVRNTDARELVELIGVNWTSLVREARMIRRQAEIGQYDGQGSRLVGRTRSGAAGQ